MSRSRFLLPLYIMVCLAPVLSRAQSLDSLEHLIATSKDPVVQARTHLKLADGYMNSDTAKAAMHLAEGKRLSESTRDGYARALFHYVSGMRLAYRSSFEESLGYFERATKGFEGFQQGPGVSEADKRSAEDYIMQAESSRGNLLLELYEYDTAVVIFEGLLGRLSRSDIPEKEIALATVNESIALAHYHLAQYPSALRYYEEAKVHAERSQNTGMLAKTLIHVGACQNILGMHDSASLRLQEAEPLVRKTNNLTLYGELYSRKAELAKSAGNYKESIAYYDSTIRYRELLGDRYMAATFSAGKARVLLLDGQAAAAERIALESLKMSEAIGKKREIISAQALLAEIYAALGDHKKAYAYEHASRIGDDSLRTQDRADEIQRMDRKFQTRLKEQRIGQLEQEQKLQSLELQRKNLINTMLLAGLLVAALITFLAIRSHRLRQEAQARRIGELEREKQLTNLEAVLRGEERERSRLAKDLHDGLGGLLSGIKYSLNALRNDLGLGPDQSRNFDRSLDMLDSSISEMRRVAHNMMPEGLAKFGLEPTLRDYCAEVDHSGVMRVRYQALGLEGVKVPDALAITVFRITQELLNNSLKHARAGETLVQLSYDSGTLSLTVEDDGAGFDVASLEGSKGMGWENIRHRVDLHKGTLDIQSHPGTGTSVTVEFNT